MVVVCQRHAVGALHVEGRVAAVGLLYLYVADAMALAVDGEAQPRHLRKVAVEHGREGGAAFQHLLQLRGRHRDAAQRIVVGQHTDDVAVGDVARHDVVAYAATVLHTDVSLHSVTVGIGHEVAGVSLLSTHNPLVVLVAHHQRIVRVSHLLRGNGLHLLVDAVDSGSHLGILIGNVRTLDELCRQAAVGRNEQLAHVGKLRTRLRDGNLPSVKVRHHVARTYLVRVAVEHHVDAAGGGYQTVRAEAQRLRRLTHMREQHHIVGALLAGGVHRLLNELVERLLLQVVHQHAVGVVERVALENHRLRRRGTHIGHFLRAILPDDVGCKQRLLCTGFIQVGTHHRHIYLLQQLTHASHAVVELVVAQRQGVVIHQPHDVGYVLAFRDSASRVTLQEVATADGSGVGRVRGVDGIAQARHLRVAVDAAVGIILI